MKPKTKLLRKNYPIDDSQSFYHGTKADLKIGDEITIGFYSNFNAQRQAKYVYLTATLDAAIWAAELAQGAGKGRIYIVKPTGKLEDDPNLTDKKFPGNPTKSYRTTEPLIILKEVLEWEGHDQEILQAMKDNIAKLKAQGIETIED